MNYTYFTLPNQHCYPPFKNGLYLEEFYLENYNKNLKKKYIPVLWTNIQTSTLYNETKLQNLVDKWIEENPSSDGYYTIVQHDDSVKIKLPSNTIVFGACNGDIPIPLIYEDKINMLLQDYHDDTYDKYYTYNKYLCSFVGSQTHYIRKKLFSTWKNDKDFYFVTSSWNVNVDASKQSVFKNVTSQSKYVLAPRGYGKSSFRLFEIIKMNRIPIYVWDDIEWLPYKDIIDWKKCIISIHIKDIENLKQILIEKEPEYESMINNLKKIKQYLTLDYMCDYIEEKISS